MHCRGHCSMCQSAEVLTSLNGHCRHQVSAETGRSLRGMLASVWTQGTRDPAMDHVWWTHCTHCIVHCTEHNFPSVPQPFTFLRCRDDGSSRMRGHDAGSGEPHESLRDPITDHWWSWYHSDHWARDTRELLTVGTSGPCYAHCPVRPLSHQPSDQILSSHL